MKLYYWKHPDGNVGDELNAWLFPKLMGPDFFDEDDTVRFLGIGSVLKPANMARRPDKNIIFGPGLRDAPSATGVKRMEIDLRFVRGPLSAAALDDAPYISDPAILVPKYITRKDPVPGRIGWIPYLRTPKAAAERIAAATGTHLVPVTMEVEPFLEELMSCEAVISEAMHGAIMADALRVPWVGCRITSSLHEGETSFFKWRDWQESLGLEAPLINGLPEGMARWPKRPRMWSMPYATARGVSVVKQLVREARYGLSDDARLATAQDRMLEAAEQLKSDWS